MMTIGRTNMKFEDLMAGLAETFDVRGGLHPDADGFVNVESGDLTLSFLEQADFPVAGHAAILVWGRFDGLMSENADALAAEMLRANDSPDDPGGPTLALLGEKVCLQQVLSLDLLDVETLARETDAFIGALMGWCERVQAYRGVPDGANEAQPPRADRPGAFERADMEYEDLAKALGGEFGNSALAPDETGRRRIEVDGTEVTVGENAARGLIAFRCTAGALPTNGAARFRCAMLHANFMGRSTAGAQLAVSEKGEIALVQTLPAALTDVGTAANRIRLLAGMARQWRKLVADYEPVAVRQAIEEEEERKLIRRMIASSILRI